MFQFEWKKYVTIANLSLILNVILAFGIYTVYKVATTKPELPLPNDDYKLIQQMAERNQKNLDDLQKSLEKIEQERQKSLEDYQVATKKILETYDLRIKGLEKKKNEQVKKTLDEFKGNLDGLANEFSNVTGIKKKDNK